MKGVVLLPCVNDRPVTLPSATWNVIVTPGAPITRNFVASIDDRTNFCPGGPPVTYSGADGKQYVVILGGGGLVYGFSL